MSFFSDLFKGNFSNLGHDLWGSPTATMETLGALGLGLGGLFAAPALFGGELGAAFGVPLAGEATAEAAAVPSLAEAATGAATAAETGSTALGYAGDVAASGGLTPAVDAGSFVDAATASTGGNVFNAGTFAPTSALSSAEAGQASGLGSWMAGVDPSGWGGSQALGFTGEASTGAVDPVASLTSYADTAADPGGYGANLWNQYVTGQGATGTQAAAGAGGQGQGFWSSLGSNTIKALENPVTDINLGLTGLTAYRGYEQQQAMKALADLEKGYAQNAAQTAAMERTAAQPLIAKGEELMSYIGTKNLPPQWQAGIDDWAKSAIAARTQAAARMGQSANPTQNTALAQDIAAIKRQALDEQGKMQIALANAGNTMMTQADQLLRSGITAEQFAAQLPILMQKLESETNAQMAQALAGLTGAMGGAKKTTTTTTYGG